MDSAGITECGSWETLMHRSTTCIDDQVSRHSNDLQLHDNVQRHCSIHQIIPSVHLKGQLGNNMA